MIVMIECFKNVNCITISAYVAYLLTMLIVLCSGNLFDPNKWKDTLEEASAVV